MGYNASIKKSKPDTTFHALTSPLGANVLQTPKQTPPEKKGK